MTLANDGDWDILKERCASRGLTGDAMAEEVLRTVTKPRTKGPLPPLPPVREAPPSAGEELPEDPLSEPEFVELAETDGQPKTWQVVRFDEPDLCLVPAKVYLNGFTLVWDDAGMPAEFPDGTPVTPDLDDLVIVDGPNVFGDVLVCRAGRPEAVARVRHDQLLIEPRG